MNKFTKILFFIIIIASLNNENKTFASPQIMASDLTWKCVGRDSFLTTLTVYMDCNGIALSVTSPLIAICESSGDSITSLITHIGNPIDITPTCSYSCTRCSDPNCSFPYGIRKYTIQNLVVLTSAGSCCSINISWQQCCRNQSITTGAAGQNYYTSATLNRCLNPCLSSPTFANAPIAIICLGQPFTYNQGVLACIIHKPINFLFQR